MTGVEYIVRQIKRLFERGTAERKVLPGCPVRLSTSCISNMGKAAVA